MPCIAEGGFCYCQSRGYFHGKDNWQLAFRQPNRSCAMKLAMNELCSLYKYT